VKLALHYLIINETDPASILRGSAEATIYGAQAAQPDVPLLPADEQQVLHVSQYA
jgi:hypothetical protein